jgi:hypothetical protein
MQSKGKITMPNFGEVTAFFLGKDVIWGMTYKILIDFISTVEALKTL